MSDGDQKQPTATGTVEEVLPNSLFRVRLGAPQPFEAGEEAPAAEAEPPAGEAKSGGGEGELVLAYLAGKMRLHRIRVLMGDQVEMVLDPYGGRARIVRRLT